MSDASTNNNTCTHEAQAAQPKILKGAIHSLESMGTVDGPGMRFVTFLQGCPLRCLFCHNPDTWEIGAPTKYSLTPQELMKEVRKYKNFIKKTGGVTCTGGEPLLQAEFVAEYFRLAQLEGYHTCLDTSGFIFNDAVKQALQHTSLVMLDIKTLDDELHRSYVGIARKNNSKFMDYLEAQNIPTWIRHVVVPGYTDRDDRLQAVAEYVAQFKCVERVEILPYHVMGAYKYTTMNLSYPLEGVEPLSAERATNAANIFRQYVQCKVVGG